MLFSVETGLMVIQLSDVSCDMGVNYPQPKGGENISNSVTHECGHLFDYMLQYTLNNSKFTKLYQKEVEDFRKIDDVEVENTRNEREYFAESFRLYLQDNAEFKDFQTYKTIERIIKNEEK